MWSASNERGSAAVDFVLVSFPLLILVNAVIFITLFSYVRTVVLDATIEGARYAALADQDLRAGELRAQQIILESIGSLVKVDIAASESSVGSIETIAFRSIARFPFDASDAWFEVSSVASREQQY
ncbi:MAG: TadE/TadG family type IV pilus assembly protein [Actinomycetota bacterium]